jgi:ADP-ribose pyrophosphatase YjhB (NUDIX family)
VHHIQRKIISLLMHAPALGYAQMRPKGVESNHFAYHLEQLVKAGLIAKSDRQYSLSAEGMALAYRVSHADLTVRQQPHIVTTTVVTNDAQQTALFTHNFQPYLGLTGFPQGRLHFEETVAQAALRELLEKTGLTGIELHHRGIIYIEAKKDGTTISKLLSHVFNGSVTGTPTLQSNDEQKGTSTWATLGDYTHDACMPGTHHIATLLQGSKDLFFDEITVTLK